MLVARTEYELLKDRRQKYEAVRYGGKSGHGLALCQKEPAVATV